MAASNLTRRIRALEKRMPPINEVSMAWQRQNARWILKFEKLFTELDEPFEDTPEAHALLENDSDELRAKDEALYPKDKIFGDIILSKAREAISKLSVTERDTWLQRWSTAPDGKGHCTFEIWVWPRLDIEEYLASRKTSKKHRRQ